MRKLWPVPLSIAAFGMVLTPVASAAPAEGPSADELRAEVRHCDQISHGEYATDDGGEETVPVCGAGGAVFWNSDLDIDCDGQVTEQCNPDTDPSFQDETAWQDSQGEHLNAAELPYIVVPGISDKFDYEANGIEGATVAAVVYQDTVTYAVVGDVGPDDIIGEASYATAEELGIDPDPATGGAEDGVTFILFPGTRADSIEDHQSAVDRGVQAAEEFVNG